MLGSAEHSLTFLPATSRNVWSCVSKALKRLIVGDGSAELGPERGLRVEHFKGSHAAMNVANPPTEAPAPRIAF